MSEIDPELWFEVTAVFKVTAADEDAAIDVISDAATDKPGLFPVAVFSARLVDSPTEAARRRVGQS